MVLPRLRRLGTGVLLPIGGSSGDELESCTSSEEGSNSHHYCGNRSGSKTRQRDSYRETRRTTRKEPPACYDRPHSASCKLRRPSISSKIHRAEDAAMQAFHSAAKVALSVQLSQLFCGSCNTCPVDPAGPASSPRLIDRHT